jgi:hypothetical protein
MLAFDSNVYVKTVLAPVAGSGSVPDMFARYCLDPAEYLASPKDEGRTKRAIDARLDEVRAHWDKLLARRNVKYEELVKRLIDEHSVAKLTLLDSDERKRAARESQAERTQREAGRREQEERFEQELAEVLSRSKGLTPRNRRILEEYARHLELDPVAVSMRLDRCPTVAEHTDAQTLPENVRLAIRKALAAYATATGNPAKGVSLFHALGFTGPEYDRVTIEASCQRLVGELRQLKPDHPVNTPLKAVLGFAKVHLVEGDPVVYMASLVLDVREALRPMAAGHAIDDDAIDALEAEQLVRAAQERGLPQQEARDLVADLAGDLNVRLLMGAAVDYVTCPNCNRPHPAASAPDRCSRCGGELFRNCPTCSARCPASDAACSNCGTDLASYLRVQRTVREARMAIESGQISMAAAIMADLPAGPAGEDESCRELSAEIERTLRQARSEWEVVERKTGERNLYAAVIQLTQLEQRATDLAGPSGLTPAQRLAELSARLGKVESLLARARSQSGAAREQSLAGALEEAADCREAAGELARIQPLPPRDVRCGDRAGQLRAAWEASPSPGPVNYRVHRSAANASTVTEVGVVGTLAITDVEAPVGEVVRYGVTCERAGASSETSWSPPVLLAREVQRLEVTVRDSEVELSWEPVAIHARVQVERTDEDSGRSEQLKPDRAGIVDRGVQNGVTYGYRVRVIYPGADGPPVGTDGAVVFARPESRPESVIDLAATTDGEHARFRFTPPESGSVDVIRCHERPCVEQGQELTQEELETLGESLPLDSKGRYDPEPAGLTWYLPVSQSGSYLIAGRAVRYLALRPIADVHAIDIGPRVRVTWSWPKLVRTAAVVWRRDRQPVDAEDARAQRLMVTKAQYAEQGGVELDAVGAEPVFLVVFSAARIGDELVAASEADRRARAAVRRTEKVQVSYAVRRSGLRKRQVLLEVLEPSDVLPELVVVARLGELLPRTVSDGRIVARLGGGSGLRRHGLDLGELGKPVALRLFLDSASDTTYTLRDPNMQELVFR